MIAKLDLRVVVDLAAKLPNLEFPRNKVGTGEWTSYHMDNNVREIIRDCEGPRRDCRNDFARAALQTKIETAALPSPMRNVVLDFSYHLGDTVDIDQREPVPNMVQPSPYDHFSSSLRLLAYQLRLFHMTSPTGSWYFQGPQGEGRTTPSSTITTSAYPPFVRNEEFCEYDVEDHGLRWCNFTTTQFRVVSIDENIVPFMTAFAKAATNMQNLKEAALWCPLAFQAVDIDRAYEDAELNPDSMPDIAMRLDIELAWGLAYAAPGQRALHVSPGIQKASYRPFWWHFGLWRSSGKLHGLLKCIGGKGEVVEYWEHDEYGRGLVSREAFEQSEMFGGKDGRSGVVKDIH
ncbi:hypothetical protein CC80DRAFT_541153 [Byssothecium circinans]|uniref:Uncharacterized protein n=1 Tax=Byssothecium circinans TaxID=147558 RepID=A0A6A5T7H7_9PLEO|nr:hypothetical protein CC80DRAFT_541153 [Byssothecium circinans]